MRSFDQPTRDLSPCFLLVVIALAAGARVATSLREDKRSVVRECRPGAIRCIIPTVARVSSHRGEKRAAWIALFLIAGPIGILAVLVMGFDLLTGLILALVCWPLAALAGYRIWRMDHPAGSAWAALRKRLRWYGGVALGVAVSISDNDPDPEGAGSRAKGDGGGF